MRKSAFVCALLLAAAACTSDGSGPLVATSLTVATSPTQIAVNGSAQASAIVTDQNGNPLTGQTIVWTSLSPTIASVNSSTGVIKGLAPGTATIQGKSGSATGTGTVIVVAPVASCLSGPVVVDLAVGQARTVSSSESKGCIKIASTAATSQYIVIAANTNPISDVLDTMVVKSDTGEVVPNSTLLANPYRVAAALVERPAPAGNEAQTAFESQLRLNERRYLRIPDAQRGYRSGSAERAAMRASLAAAIPNVGDKRKFNVPLTGNGCTNFATVTASVKYISTRAIIYSDSTSPSGGFTLSDYQAIASEFDNLIYPTDVAYFGNPLDLDSNGRIIILYTPQVNKMTKSGNPGSFVGGFFFSGDLYPATGQGACTESNVGELFYALTPDPNGVIVPNGGGSGNPRSTDFVRKNTRGVIAHELQHMINASERIADPAIQDFEDVWLDEGLSHMAEDVNGRVQLGIADGSNTTFATIVSNNDDFNAFFYQNFVRLSYYMRPVQPAGSSRPVGYFSPTSMDADTSLADRGAIWSLLRYAADNYAPGGDVKSLTRALVCCGHIGVDNLVTRTGVPFDTLIAGWMIANYADDAGISGLPAKYTYKSYNLRDVMSAPPFSAGQSYPLVVTDITGTGFIASNLVARSGSGNYFRFTRPGGGSARSFRIFNKDGTTAASFNGASFFILRTR